MKRLPGFLGVILVVALILTTPIGASAQAIGTVTQLGVNNDVYIYQELRSEVIIIQLGNENSAEVEQEGSDHIAGVGQVGDENMIQIVQGGQKNLVLAIQTGDENDATISQIQLVNRGSLLNISNHDAFSYQSGSLNKLSLEQIEDENITSNYQIGDNNQVLVFQVQELAATGSNAVFVVQAGSANWAEVQQFGAHQLARSIQSGDGNRSSISQMGTDNTASVSQSGNSNHAIINQG